MSRPARSPSLRQLGLLLLSGFLWTSQAQSTLTPPAAPIEAKVGDFLPLPLNVAGLAMGRYQVQATLPEGWQLLSEEVEVDTGKLLLSVFVPDNARAGANTLKFKLLQQERVVQEVIATVQVQARPAFLVTFPRSDRVRPGARRTYTATVTNTGNIADSVRLQLEGSGTLSVPQLNLEPGQTGKVQVSYAHRSSGNADSLTLTATSTLNPQLSSQSILSLSVGEGSAVQSTAPRLSWTVAVAPEVSYGPRAPQVVSPTVPTQPGLPGSQPDLSAPDAWVWRGNVAAGIAGALSDYVSGSASYTLGRDDNLKLNDDALMRLDWKDTALALSARNQARQVNMTAQRVQGPFSFGVQAGRYLSADGAARYSLTGSVQHQSGLYGWAGAGTDDQSALGLGLNRDLGPFRVRSDLSLARSGAQWSTAFLEQLNYENALLLAEQRYQYSSSSRSSALDLRISSRQSKPLSLTGTLNLNSTSGQWRYEVAGLAYYQPQDDFRAKLRAALGTSGPDVQADILKVWKAGLNELYLSTQGSYRSGEFSGFTQATAQLPRGQTSFLITGGVGYRQGLAYAAGLGVTHGALQAAAGLDSDPKRSIFTASLAYQPQLGLAAGLDFRQQREGLRREQQWQGRVGYNTERFQLGLLGGAVQQSSVGQPSQPVQWLYGVQGAYQVTDALQLRAQVQRQGERTRAAVGLNFATGGAFNTPAGVVQLFGGQEVGTLKLHAFLDLDRDGKRSAGEPPANLPLSIGGRDVTPKDGQASVDLRPGSYTVQLGADVPAQYAVAQQEPLTIALKKTVQHEVAIQQVGRLQGILQDETEKPLSGVTVQLSGPEGTLQTVTDSTGAFRISNLAFGPHTLVVQANPALYQPLPQQQVNVTGQQPLITLDLTLTSIQEVHGVSSNTLTLEATGPDLPLPPGALVPIQVQAPDAEKLSSEPAAQEVIKQDGGAWLLYVPIPKDQQVPLEVQVNAEAKDRSGQANVFLMVDPSLKAQQLAVRPLNALPGQVIDLVAQVYFPAKTVAVRDASGQVTELKATAPFRYEGSLKAAAAGGTQTLTLLVDEQDKAQGTYEVLGPKK